MGTSIEKSCMRPPDYISHYANNFTILRIFASGWLWCWSGKRWLTDVHVDEWIEVVW